tara:strand:- start:84 stop:233 length:150 start_codon:yes stop_codon:yes gene_type:complete
LTKYVEEKNKKAQMYSPGIPLEKNRVNTRMDMSLEYAFSPSNALVEYNA